MKNSKKQTWAQRKFAQGSQPPAGMVSNTSREEPAIVETTRVPNTIIQNMNATELMDLVAFRGLHEHHNQPVVVLERLDMNVEADREPAVVDQDVSPPKRRSNNRRRYMTRSTNTTNGFSNEDDTPLTLLRNKRKKSEITDKRNGGVDNVTKKRPISSKLRKTTKRKCTVKNSQHSQPSTSTTKKVYNPKVTVPLPIQLLKQSPPPTPTLSRQFNNSPQSSVSDPIRLFFPTSTISLQFDNSSQSSESDPNDLPEAGSSTALHGSSSTNIDQPPNISAETPIKNLKHSQPSTSTTKKVNNPYSVKILTVPLPIQLLKQSPPPTPTLSRQFNNSPQSSVSDPIRLFFPTSTISQQFDNSSQPSESDPNDLPEAGSSTALHGSSSTNIDQPPNISAETPIRLFFPTSTISLQFDNSSQPSESDPNDLPEAGSSTALHGSSSTNIDQPPNISAETPSLSPALMMPPSSFKASKKRTPTVKITKETQVFKRQGKVLWGSTKTTTTEVTSQPVEREVEQRPKKTKLSETNEQATSLDKPLDTCAVKSVTKVVEIIHGSSDEPENSARPFNYYDANNIQKWIEQDVLSKENSLNDEVIVIEDEPEPATAVKCLAEEYKSLQQVSSAMRSDLDKLCRACSPCRRVSKVNTLIELIRQLTDSPSDVYTFEDVEESAQAHRFRSRRGAATEPDSDNIYLDLLPRNSPHIVRITVVEVANRPNKILRASLVPKVVATGTNLLIADCENLIDELLNTLSLNLPPPQASTSLPALTPTLLKATSQTMTLHSPTPQSLTTQAQTPQTPTSQTPLVQTPPVQTLPVQTPPVQTPPVQTPPVQTPLVQTPTAQTPTQQTAATQTPTKRQTTQSQRPYVPRSFTPTTTESIGNPTSPGFSIDEKESSRIVEAPVFYPTAEEFKDPIAYFEKIMLIAEKYAICKIVAPEGFNPSCNLAGLERFNVMNQYIVRLYNRWGPASREMCAIKAHLASQSVLFSKSPLLDGSEVNLPKLFNLVQQQGGLKRVIEKKRWSRVAEEMRCTKLSRPEQKLDKIYVKYLLPYDTMSNRERQQLLSAVDRCWSKKNQKILNRAVSPLRRRTNVLNGVDSSAEDSSEDEDGTLVTWALADAEDCIVSGRSMNLPNFKKIAKSVMATHFPGPTPPSPAETETMYWKLVVQGTEHVCVYTASVDTGEQGHGFPTNIEDPCSNHPWNLKVMSKNKSNMLRFMGPVVGVTAPTLHLGMVFSTSCWHRDPHGLPWVEYMHNGPSKIWYGIPDGQSQTFRKAVETLCPSFCQNKTVWLPSDITMIPPSLLVEHGVTLSRIEQNPREFILVLPKAYSCSICTGYTESESVYFATGSWFDNIGDVFGELRATSEPTMFALEHLLLGAAAAEELEKARRKRAAAWLQQVLTLEMTSRRALASAGVTVVPAPASEDTHRTAWDVRQQYECEICRATLYLSYVKGIPAPSTACPTHALQLLNIDKHRQNIKKIDLHIKVSDDELKKMLSDAQAILSIA